MCLLLLHPPFLFFFFFFSTSSCSRFRQTEQPRLACTWFSFRRLLRVFFFFCLQRYIRSVKSDFKIVEDRNRVLYNQPARLNRRSRSCVLYKQDERRFVLAHVNLQRACKWCRANGNRCLQVYISQTWPILYSGSWSRRRGRTQTRKNKSIALHVRANNSPLI